MVSGLKDNVVTVGLNVTEFQLLTKFSTFTDPRPDARSYPTAALYCDVVSPGTILLPTVTSLKMQLLAGRPEVFEPLHCDSVSAAARR